MNIEQAIDDVKHMYGRLQNGDQHLYDLPAIVAAITPKELDQLRKELAEAKAVIEKLPRTKDGVVYIDKVDDRTFWCLFRHYEEEQWRVSKCHLPQDPDEASLDVKWVVDDAEDQCDIIGPYSTSELAEAALTAKEATNG